MRGAQPELFGASPELPAGFVYRTDFIDTAEEAALLGGIRGLALEAARYRQYTARRRVAYFGHAYDFSSNHLGEAPPLPGFLISLRDRVARWMELAPAALEHALVNEYQPGTPLGWHRDAPDFGRVAGVSLGGWARMRFRPYPPGKKERTLELHLAPRSAYRMEDAARWRWQHSVPATRELRYSVTFRTVLRKD